MINQSKFFVFIISFFWLSNLYSQENSGFGRFKEIHISPVYGAGYSWKTNSLTQKFGIGFTRNFVGCLRFINHPNKNLIWFDLLENKTYKFGYSRNLVFGQTYGKKRGRAKPGIVKDNKSGFVLETGIGFLKAENSQDVLLRLSPKFDIRLLRQLELGPYYSLDYSIFQNILSSEFGLKIAFHFGLLFEIKHPDKYSSKFGGQKK